MTDRDYDGILDNLPWNALNTEHARFAISAQLARKYPAEVAPFAGTQDGSPQAFLQLASLMEPGETVFLIGAEPPEIPELIVGEKFPALRMIAAATATAPSLPASTLICRLQSADASAMVALTDIAYPGFFRRRTCEMGTYYGIHIDGQLVAMAGERMAVPGHTEISGVCTRPSHTSKGYAASLLQHLLRQHAANGIHSFLHVNSSNSRAINLYERLGFRAQKELFLYPVENRGQTPHFPFSVPAPFPSSHV